MYFRVTFGALLALLSTCLALAPAETPSGAKTLKIVAFGDSTTAPRPAVEEVYAQRLETLLRAGGVAAEVVNAGVGGSHTGRLADNARHRRRHALDRLDEAVRSVRPDVVIVQFGINDCWVDSNKPGGPSRIPLDRYGENLTTITRTLQGDGARVVLMTPNPLGGRYEAWRQERLARYAGAVRRVAAATGADLVDVWAEFESFAARSGQGLDALLVDGQHPNDRGHALVAGRLAALLGGESAEPAAGRPGTDAGGEIVPQALDRFTIPLIDLAHETQRQVVVDRQPEQYLGHPTTVLLEDGRTMLCVYPKGHGGGAIVYKRSDDGGLTWSERLPVPKSWATSKEVPTLFRVVDAEGKKRIIMFSGLYPCRMAVSEDDGTTWSELEPVGDWGGIVTMGCVAELKTGRGHYLAMFHDDGRFFAATPRRKSPVVMTLYKTFSSDGGMTWSFPQAIYRSSDVQLCEPGIIRSPDGKQLAVLLRENARRKNSQIIFSDDEGRTWSEPREMPAALVGDRHTGRYGPDGRLLISFRDVPPRGKTSPTSGDWVGWVGTYEDLVQGRQGQYRIRLMDNHRGADCAYPGVEVLPDGTFVATTYGHWTEGQQPYIVSVRLKLEELDAKAKRLAAAARP